MKLFPENFLWGAASASFQIEGARNDPEWWRRNPASAK